VAWKPKVPLFVPVFCNPLPNVGGVEAVILPVIAGVVLEVKVQVELAACPKLFWPKATNNTKTIAEVNVFINEGKNFFIIKTFCVLKRYFFIQQDKICKLHD
jgi:hypothetical protein